MTDVFDAQRRTVRSLQDAVKRLLIDRRSAIERHRSDPEWLRVVLSRIDGDIAAALLDISIRRERMPPHAELRDGVIWLKPVEGPIDPMEAV